MTAEYIRAESEQLDLGREAAGVFARAWPAIKPNEREDLQKKMCTRWMQVDACSMDNMLTMIQTGV